MRRNYPTLDLPYWPGSITLKLCQRRYAVAFARAILSPRCFKMSSNDRSNSGRFKQAPNRDSNIRTSRPTDSDSSRPTPTDSSLASYPDATIELRIDDCEPLESENAPGVDADQTQVLSEQNLLNSANQDLPSADDTTTSFEIPSEMIEPLEKEQTPASRAHNTVKSNQVDVFDPHATRQAPAVPNSAAPHKPKKSCSTIKMKPARGRPRTRAHLPSTSAETATQFDPAKLRDIDEDGFHIFVARPDEDGRIYLPREIFEVQTPPESSMVFIKAKILHSD